jgi:Domain of Unknown Function (DUF1206)
MSSLEHPQGAAETVRERARDVKRSRWLGWVGRAGLLAKGVSYVLVGVLAIAVASGVGGEATDREGALEVVADEFFGAALILALALGFAAYAFWRLAQALLDRENEGTGGGAIAKRLGYVGRAALYLGLAATALTLLDGTGSDSTQTAQAREATAEVLTWPAGRWLVAGIGLAFLAAAGFNAYRAVTQKFEEKWYVDDLGERTKGLVGGLSSAGLLARFVVFGLIGLFLVKAAWQYDPQETVGLDGALRLLLDEPYGGGLLGALAAGLLCYALFCFAEARYRRV